MKVDYRTPLQVIANSLQHYHQITVQTEEVGGMNFFPTTGIGMTGDGSATNILRYNPSMRVLLSLYNAALEPESHTSEAIVHYALFQACMETSHYSEARTHLNAFRQEVSQFSRSPRNAEEQETYEGKILIQQYFTLYHEAFHLVWHHYPDLGDEAKGRTRQLLLDIKEEWTEGLLLVHEPELYLHPKIQQQLVSMIPQEMDEENRQEMHDYLKSQWAKNAFSPNYIDNVIQNDSGLVEEMTCDRLAWNNLLSIFQSDGATVEDVRQMHLWLFSVFYAMDFNKVLLSQFVPAIHGQATYNGMRVLLRHKAFKNLLHYYNPEAYENARSEFLNLSTGLSSVYRSSVMALFRYGNDLAKLYADHQAGVRSFDIAEHRRLQTEMAEICANL